VGLLLWIKEGWQRVSRGWRAEKESWGAESVLVFTLFLLVPVFLFLYHDLVASRFLRLDTPIEAPALSERLRDAGLALELIAAHPWRGVGAGNYLASVHPFHPDAITVHNVPLLVTAELGVLGLAFWLWLTLAPFVRKCGEVEEQRSFHAPMLPCSHAQKVPWLALVIIGLFDNTLWMFTSWDAAILFALVSANASPFPVGIVYHANPTILPAGS
jgi:O-antigen ligase